MPKTRHIPIRTCVACRETDEKRDLLRVVRQPDGIVRYEPKGKLSGRGAYVCARVACIAQARKQKKLERSLKVTHISDELFAELNANVTIPELQPAPAMAGETPSSEASAPDVVTTRNNMKERMREEV